ncbi:MAG: hypothetical protein HYR89_04710 [Actinobacteria bacterium]|nr:hypothetical protein [Actinomycetota bacterium]MBI3257823.1 hypothetical protein [Actinomycetota bacterium]
MTPENENKRGDRRAWLIGSAIVAALIVTGIMLLANGGDNDDTPHDMPGMNMNE